MRYPINNRSDSPEQCGPHRRESLSTNIEDNHLPRFLKSQSVISRTCYLFPSANFVFPLLPFWAVIHVVKVQPNVGMHSPFSENIRKVVS